MQYDVEHTNKSRRGYRPQLLSDWWCRVTGAAQCILLRSANWIVHHWAWWGVAHVVGTLYRVSRPDLVRDRHSTSMVVVSCSEAKDMRVPQAISRCLDEFGDCRLCRFADLSLLGRLCATLHVGFVEIDPMKNKLLALGVGGTILAILCCFTPLLPILLTALGLTGLLGVVYKDAVLLPILAGFLILTGYALWRRKKQK
jgi:hypothetical protein